MATNDYKILIIDQLDIVMKKARNDNEKFKALAYDKVIKQLRLIDKPITTYDDLNHINGIGKGIETKIKEILATGKLQIAEDLIANENANMSIYEQLLKVHGIGIVKARNLIEKNNIKSIAQLRLPENAKLLNNQQKIGLKYYEEINERIPRTEMKKHEKLILKELKDKNAIIVGSYRRELNDSGDIDVLISEENFSGSDLKAVVENLKKSGYITDILALGEHKCMAVVQLKSKSYEKHRRLDLLLTPEKEFATSVLYFTGSQRFNIEMRKIALSLGYSLSEHGVKKLKKNIADPPIFKTEKDVFDFLKMKYVEPKNR